MPFVKLDCAILTSTLWPDMDARNVFLTALLMAEPRELLKPTPALRVDRLRPAGFTVPPGWYGFVSAAGPGIVRYAGLEQGRGMKALERLSAPDRESRSKDHSGRRMVRVDGGYIVLNYQRFRDRDYTAAARSARYRARKASHRSNVTSHRNITQAEGEGEAEAEEGGRTPATLPPPPRFPLHCPDHQETEFPPKCGGCRERREAAEREAKAEASVGKSSSKAGPQRVPDPNCVRCKGTGYPEDRSALVCDCLREVTP